MNNGDRVHTRNSEGRVQRRGTYRGETHDGWAKVAWDGDRTVSQTSSACLEPGEGRDPDRDWPW